MGSLIDNGSGITTHIIDINFDNLIIDSDYRIMMDVESPYSGLLTLDKYIYNFKAPSVSYSLPVILTKNKSIKIAIVKVEILNLQYNTSSSSSVFVKCASYIDCSTGGEPVPPPPVPVPVPVPAPEPTLSLTPEVTPETTPTTTPVETSTPVATSTPAATSTPVATSTPAVTSTPEATSTPAVTSTPAATSTPAVTSTPAATSTPAVTSTPTSTATGTPICAPLYYQGRTCGYAYEASTFNTFSLIKQDMIDRGFNNIVIASGNVADPILNEFDWYAMCLCDSAPSRGVVVSGCCSGSIDNEDLGPERTFQSANNAFNCSNITTSVTVRVPNCLSFI